MSNERSERQVISVVSPPRPLLSVQIDHAGYGRRQVIHDIELRVGEGEVLTVMGHNGAGKTTTLRAIYGLLPSFSGRVCVGEAEELHPRSTAMFAHGVAFVPAPPNVFVSLTVKENLLLALDKREARRRGSDAVAPCLELFPALGSRLSMLCGQLSGGQKQMVAIGRALLSEPKVLLLDEPSVGLAPVLAEEVIGRVRHVAESGTAVVLVEQTVGLALSISDYYCVLKEGKVRATGSASSITSASSLWELF